MFTNIVNPLSHPYLYALYCQFKVLRKRIAFKNQIACVVSGMWEKCRLEFYGVYGCCVYMTVLPSCEYLHQQNDCILSLMTRHKNMNSLSSVLRWDEGWFLYNVFYRTKTVCAHAVHTAAEDFMCTSSQSLFSFKVSVPLKVAIILLFFIDFPPQQHKFENTWKKTCSRKKCSS